MGRLTGYAEQDIVLLQTATVQESVAFAAAMRLDGSRVSSVQRSDFVHDTLAVLEVSKVVSILHPPERIFVTNPSFSRRSLRLSPTSSSRRSGPAN